MAEREIGRESTLPSLERTLYPIRLFGSLLMENVRPRRPSSGIRANVHSLDPLNDRIDAAQETYTKSHRRRGKDAVRLTNPSPFPFRARREIALESADNVSKLRALFEVRAFENIDV